MVKKLSVKKTIKRKRTFVKDKKDIDVKLIKLLKSEFKNKKNLNSILEKVETEQSLRKSREFFSFSNSDSDEMKPPVLRQKTPLVNFKDETFNVPMESEKKKIVSYESEKSGDYSGMPEYLHNSQKKYTNFDTGGFSKFKASSFDRNFGERVLLFRNLEILGDKMEDYQINKEKYRIEDKTEGKKRNLPWKEHDKF
ncbi:MAG: hypothetical protein QW727_03175 [Candidatus Pacearchaeota archaeon]